MADERPSSAHPDRTGWDPSRRWPPLGPELIEALRPLIVPHIRRTPLLRSERLSAESGKEIYLKCEGLQLTGSFKLRGAIAALARLRPEERAAGVVAASAGNHGQGLARAAQIFAVPCTVVVPRHTPEVKVEGMRSRGARVIHSPHDGYDATERWTRERLDELGGRWISPFDDDAVIAGGGGTLGLEIIEEGPRFDAIVVPCGGGGCVTGIGIAARGKSPGTRVIGVNSEASPGMWRSWRDSHAYLEIESEPTIAEGIEGGVSARSYARARAWADEIVLCREATIRRAVVELLRGERLLVEGSGGAAVAALLDGRLATSGRTLCLVLTGSNIDVARLGELLAGDS